MISHNDHDQPTVMKIIIIGSGDDNDHGNICNDDYDAYLTRVLLFDRKLGVFEGLVDFGDFWELDLWLFGFFVAPWVTVLTENRILCQLDADPWLEC